MEMQLSLDYLQQLQVCSYHEEYLLERDVCKEVEYKVQNTIQVRTQYRVKVDNSNSILRFMQQLFPTVEPNMQSIDTNCWWVIMTSDIGTPFKLCTRCWAYGSTQSSSLFFIEYILFDIILISSVILIICSVIGNIFFHIMFVSLNRMNCPVA